LNLDLSKFKKIEDGDKHTTLLHDNGHELKVAHKGLSDKFRKQLEEMPVQMAKGGYAKYAQKFDPNAKKQIYQQRPGHGIGPEASGISQVSKTSQPSKDPSYNEPQDQGATGLPKLQRKPVSEWNIQEPKSKQMYPPCINPSCKSYGHSHPNCRCYGGNEYASERFAEGGPVEKEYYCDANRMHKKGCEYYADGGDVQTQSQAADPADDAVNDANIQSQASPTPQQPDNQAPQSDIVQQPQAGPQESQQQPEQPMTPDQNPATVDPYQQYQKNMLDTNQLMHNEANKFFSDVDQGHIQPKTMGQLFHDKSLPGKIGTLFGLIVAGGGAGLTHQDNAVLTTMQKEINNDLQAQEQNQKNRTNIMSINGDNLTKLANAGKVGADTRQMQIAMSKAQANYYLYNQLAQQAGNLSNPQQSAKAQQTLALMRAAMLQDNASAFAQAAGANALGNMLHGQGNTTALKTGLYGPEAQEMGGDVEQKTIPGIPGTAARPIQQHDRDQVQAMNVLDTKLKDIQSFAKQHEGSINPNVLAQGRQKAAELVNFYNQSIQGGVLTEGRLAWLDSQINKNPTTIFQNMLGNNAKLQEVQNSNSMRRDALLKSYGFPLAKQNKQPSNSGSTGTQQQGGTSKSGRAIVYKNGKAYYQ
jgi:hypothetical protein